jgi:hypothetical protein
MTDKPTVVEALAAVMGDVREVRKADRNTQQNYQFRGIDAVMNAVGPALRKHNVVVVPLCEQANYRDVQTSTGKASRECTVLVRYRFYGPAGDHIECVAPGESMDFGDKGAPKAMSVAFRTVLLQALCLPTDDPEPDASTYERTTPAAPDQATQARQRLAATCAENRWDLGRVAARFATEHGGALREAADAAVIERFRKSLFNVSDAELKAPATNGAQA